MPVAVGLFGISEILLTAGQNGGPAVQKPRLRELMPSREEWRRSSAPIARGSVLGFLIGIIPGSAHIISSFVSYALERRISKHPERFGKGAIEGVAGPEVRQQRRGVRRLRADAGARHADGPDPGGDDRGAHGPRHRARPAADQQQPELFWGFVASMYVGNLVLLILNLPLVGLFVNLLRIPYALSLPVHPRVLHRSASTRSTAASSTCGS